MNALIDFDQGLKHCDNQHRIYLAVLRQFLAQYQNGLNYDAMLQSPEHAQLELHTLKGLCATIGATHLSQLAATSFQHWTSISSADAQVELSNIAEELTALVQVLQDYLKSSNC
ncbi:Hpt domain-containing protein [Idiomarina aquatica]|uniref:Hpt domain-containing protein n=1 Tax=Idiomarina aquatica TaxID=1327752 RepID=A0AA94EHR4_9GAMM|nr:Hpt domain-containing protein [Idiomarina aquatica]RUO45284.1 Hpt domain-containing protein [Idiomarina aquatica]